FFFFFFMALLLRCVDFFPIASYSAGFILLRLAGARSDGTSNPKIDTLSKRFRAPWYIFFRRGLITDLSNPQTVLFFISIFSVTLNAETPTWARLMAWAG
ncbi:LysE family transporter, partial [Escherichia coli]|uniref:LysE family transporter n=1 Tax=Escherichia coli TaxID=562 RepID=UPI001485916D